MKGIVLAGGTGSRLWPITRSVSKQLLPVYDKPMIYYPISTLMLAGVREILIITTLHDQYAFKNLLGDGSQFGIRFEYAVQHKPEGLAQAFLIAENFLLSDSAMLVLGDNLFHGSGLGHQLESTIPQLGGHIFTYEVANPSDYGVLEIDELGRPISIEEKPSLPKSNLAITGLYYFDNQVVEIAKAVQPSSRGELEITSVIRAYLQEAQLTYTQLSRGTAWLDTGNPKSMHDAASYIQIIEERTGLKVACLEEIAYSNHWIGDDELFKSAEVLGKSSYGDYLRKILKSSTKKI
jgi:glucose-1-phosphate thymidylyltransferase